MYYHPKDYSNDEDAYLYDVTRAILGDGLRLRNKIYNLIVAAGSDEDYFFENTRNYIENVQTLCLYLQSLHPIVDNLEIALGRVKDLEKAADAQDTRTKEILYDAFQLALKLAEQEKEIIRLNGIIELSNSMIAADSPSRPKRG